MTMLLNAFQIAALEILFQWRILLSHISANRRIRNRARKMRRYFAAFYSPRTQHHRGLSHTQRRHITARQRRRGNRYDHRHPAQRPA